MRAEIDRLTGELAPFLADARSPADKVAALNRFVFGHLGMRASQDLDDPGNLVLSRVLATRQGYCVGLASL